MNLYEEQKFSPQKNHDYKRRTKIYRPVEQKLTIKETKSSAAEHIKSIYEKQKLVHGRNHNYKEGTKNFRPINKPRL
jgi:hypothetical protein